MDRVLFRPPPEVRAPDEIRRVYQQRRSSGRPTIGTDNLSHPDFEHLAAAAGDRAAFAKYTNLQLPLGTGETPVLVSFVTRDFFSVLGIRPFRGRFFAPDETLPIEPARHLAVISAGLWAREFGTDSSILGRPVMIGGLPFTVVGIAPRRFRGLDHSPVDVWAPLGSILAAANGPGRERFSLTSRGRSGGETIARMPSGEWNSLISLLTAQLRESQRSEPWADSAARVIVTPLLDPWGPAGGSALRRRNAELSVRIVVVALAVLVVSLLNGATMLSLRGVERRREIAIRLGLGMPSGRLVWHHVLEAACIAVLSVGLAALLGWWGATALDARVLSTLQPSPPGIDARWLAMTALLTLAVLVAMALIPAATTRKLSAANLRPDGLTGGAGDSLMRGALVGAQTAACVALVMLAALSLNSLRQIATVDFGFDVTRLVSLESPLGTDARELHEAVAALPLVESASFPASPPYQGSGGVFATPEQGTFPDSIAVRGNTVGPDYVRTAGIRLLAGRVLSDSDVAGAQNVIVVTRTMANLIWPGVSPLGKCALVWGNFAKCRYVVGVVDDVHWEIGAPARALFFAPNAQAGSTGGRSVLIRTKGPALPNHVAEIERVARAAHTGGRGRPRAIRLVDALDPQLAPLRAASTLFALFGVLALVSAAAGLFGLITYHVSQRTREVGIRIALGASGRSVAALVARWVAIPFTIGIVGGAALGLAGGSFMAAFLFETSGHDPGVLSTVAVIIGAAAVAAGIAPARRAAKLDPVAALRSD